MRYLEQFYLDAEGRRYLEGLPFRHGDTNYAGAAATPEMFAQLGMKLVKTAPVPDETKFLVDGRPNDDGSWNTVPLPEPPPAAVLTAEQKLAALGLTIEDLQELLTK